MVLVRGKLDVKVRVGRGWIEGERKKMKGGREEESWRERVTKREGERKGKREMEGGNE